MISNIHTQCPLAVICPTELSTLWDDSVISPNGKSSFNPRAYILFAIYTVTTVK